MTADPAPQKPVEQPTPATNGSSPAKPTPAAKPKAKAKARRVLPPRPFPRLTIKQAERLPFSIKKNNGGKPWKTDDIAKSVKLGRGGEDFFYLVAASRQYGWTDGSRNSPEIKLEPGGNDLVYALSPEALQRARMEAFLRVPLFKGVLEHYGSSQLPEPEFVSSLLESKFALAREHHEEFIRLFKENCEYLEIGPQWKGLAQNGSRAKSKPIGGNGKVLSPDVVTVAEPESETALTCFVVMPFTERQPDHPSGFFQEVLRRLIAPAAKEAGFRVVTANRRGSDVIQATIVNGVLDADLVIADLTEHNPNVHLELGMRIVEDKPVALIKAMGTGAVFDVDNMLRVETYNPNLWASTIEEDLPRLAQHIRETWENRETNPSFLKILRKQGGLVPP